MKHHYKLTGLALAAGVIFSLNSQAQTIEANGHTYQVVHQSQISWEMANKKAAAMGDGWHLATITSEEESAVLSQLLDNVKGEFWVGAQQTSDERADANWEWVTGESFEFVDWHKGEPNDYFGRNAEKYLAIWSAFKWEWNDEGNVRAINGYILEKDPESTSDNVTSTNDPFLTNADLHLYPNPNAGEFTLKLSGADFDQGTLQVLNIVGKEVHSERLSMTNGYAQHTLALPDLPVGTYFIQVVGGNQRYSEKFMIRK